MNDWREKYYEMEAKCRKAYDDAERYRWFRDQCSQQRRITIAEYAEKGYLLDHHIDKGRCGL